MGKVGGEEDTVGVGIMKEFGVELSSDGCYTNAQPMWSWNNWGTIPGALLVPQCAAAAYRTVPPTFHIHTVQTQFLGAGTVTKPVTFRVEVLGDGNTFKTRQVKAEQDGRAIALAVVGFAKRTEGKGREGVVVEYAVPAQMPVEAPREECDQVKYLRGDGNSSIQGYPLPIVAKGLTQTHTSKLTRHWLRLVPPIPTENATTHNLLALLALSDIFLTDSAPRIYGLDWDLPTEPSLARRLAGDLKAMATLNHTVHIVDADKVRVNDWVYVECDTPWASKGRVMVRSRVFGREGDLLATCVQEALLLLTKGAGERIAVQKL